MVLDVGNIVISCQDRILLENDLNNQGYKHLEVDVCSSDKKYALTIRINSGLTFEQRLQSIVINTIARLTFNPDKSRNAEPLNYVSFDTRLRDYDGGYWEKLICSSNYKVNLNISMIIGYGFVA